MGLGAVSRAPCGDGQTRSFMGMRPSSGSQPCQCTSVTTTVGVWSASRRPRLGKRLGTQGPGGGGEQEPVKMQPPTNYLSETRGGGGVLEGERGPGIQKIVYPKPAQPDFPDCKFRFFPRWSLWSVGGGGPGGRTLPHLRCTAILILPSGREVVAGGWRVGVGGGGVAGMCA